VGGLGNEAYCGKGGAASAAIRLVEVEGKGQSLEGSGFGNACEGYCRRRGGQVVKGVGQGGQGEGLGRGGLRGVPPECSSQTFGRG